MQETVRALGAEQQVPDLGLRVVIEAVQAVPGSQTLPLDEA